MFTYYNLPNVYKYMRKNFKTHTVNSYIVVGIKFSWF